ncbi:MAG TPA: carotenoid 1,2-hydratase [Burkholderiales bacterium]|nr:carotenoid 1,2-hydratase [Burkholderiales bacterium]
MNRREFLAAGLAFPLVVPGRPLRFPRDHGAHPGYRQEWWYVTGWLKTARGEELGFQVTFFRTRLDFENANPSSFTPRQVILAHAALADPKLGRLRHDERAARTALDLAGSREGTTSTWVDDWVLDMKDDSYQTRVRAKDFSLDLEFAPQGPLVLQGENGFSRKGPGPEEASYYYSRPQLAVRGSVDGARVTGTAWLDHEWSSQYMAAGAAGWDWCGINLEDGGSLMAFRMRGKDGNTAFAPPGIAFEVLRTWKSPRTGAEYPIEVMVTTKEIQLRLQPLMDDQELDARASTGTIYWEGAVRAFRADRQVGRGYLELTGYWRPMKL